MDLPDWNAMEQNTVLPSVRIAGRDLKPGDRVRLWPHGRADIMDMVLEGRIATIEAIEQDYENRAHVAVVIDDDPGRDLGMLRQVGHRFFFSPEEIEPFDEDSSLDGREQ
jgi:hypothetical protein